MSELDRIADRFAVGELFPEDLPMAAAEALACGHDSPALVELACLYRTDTRDAPALFRTAIAELGLVENSEAAWSAREVVVRRRRAGWDATRALADGDIVVDHPSRTASDSEADFGDLSRHLDEDHVDQESPRDDTPAKRRKPTAGAPRTRPVATASFSTWKWWQALRRLWTAS
ncbi:hypothetical protein [Nocardia asteroides]|uniref:hypothetical protein n=1 Tax=Nocardia asteroides TaxID=1824 RepID=UPI003447BFD9